MFAGLVIACQYNVSCSLMRVITLVDVLAAGSYGDPKGI